MKLSVCFIVRDNERVIQACLDSVRRWANELVVVDTGSEDSTPDIAERNGASVFSFPWIDDFSAARNESLRHARGEWLFWMDSDDTLPAECGRRLRELADGEHEPDTLGYVMQVHCPGPSGEEGDVTVVDHVKMFRNHPEIRFEGRIHEQVLPSIRRLGGKVEWTDIYVVHSGADQSPAGRRRKYERDLRILALELAERPDCSFHLFNLGMTYADMGDFAQAEQHLRRCIEVGDPGESHIRKAFALLINALAMVEKHGEAWHQCALGRQLFPHDVELRFREALLHHHFGRLIEAERCYRSTIDEPDERHFTSVDAGIGGYKARHNLAVVYLDMGRPDLAEAEWRAVLDEVPRFRPANRALGDLLLSQGRKVTAKLEAERMARDERLRVEGLLLEARIATKEGDADRAGDLLHQAVEEFPHDTQAIDALSQHYFAQGRPQDAVEILTRLVEQRPDDAGALHNLGTAQLAAGQHVASIDTLRRSLDIRPTAAMTHLQLGYALKAQGNLDAAISAWLEAARLESGYPSIKQTLSEHAQLQEA
jgi:tetratricopeptide (TPR) repeat protein